MNGICFGCLRRARCESGCIHSAHSEAIEIYRCIYKIFYRGELETTRLAVLRGLETAAV